MKKMVFAFLAMGLFSTPTLAKDNKADLVKKIYLTYSEDSVQEFDFAKSSYVSPEFRKVIIQFNRFDDKIRKNPDMEMGCDMYPHYYLGMGNGGVPDNFKKTLQVENVNANTVRATFKDFDGKRVGADLTVNCEGNYCAVDDVKTLGSRTSMKADFQKVLKTKFCS